MDPTFYLYRKDKNNISKYQYYITLGSVINRISDVKTEIALAQKDNFEKWPTLDKCYGAALIALGSWEAEVDYVNDFFTNRINWMDNYINSLN